MVVQLLLADAMSYLDPECKYCGMVHWQGVRFRPKVCIQALQDELRRTRYELTAKAHNHRRLKDLEVVVKDQQRHIANLEDQLLGYQRPEQGEQEAML
jgi:hypothetical protein